MRHFVIGTLACVLVALLVTGYWVTSRTTPIRPGFVGDDDVADRTVPPAVSLVPSDGPIDFIHPEAGGAAHSQRDGAPRRDRRARAPQGTSAQGASRPATWSTAASRRRVASKAPVHPRVVSGVPGAVDSRGAGPASGGRYAVGVGASRSGFARGRTGPESASTETNGNGRIGMVIGKCAVGFAEQRHDVGAKPREHVLSDETGDAVATVHHHPERARQRAVSRENGVGPLLQHRRIGVETSRTGIPIGFVPLEETPQLLYVVAVKGLARYHHLESVELGWIV